MLLMENLTSRSHRCIKQPSKKCYLKKFYWNICAAKHTLCTHQASALFLITEPVLQELITGTVAENSLLCLSIDSVLAAGSTRAKLYQEPGQESSSGPDPSYDPIRVLFTSNIIPVLPIHKNYSISNE